MYFVLFSCGMDDLPLGLHTTYAAAEIQARFALEHPSECSAVKTTEDVLHRDVSYTACVHVLTYEDGVLTTGALIE